MDLSLPGMSGIECTRELKHLFPALQVLMLTIEENAERVFEALRAGATGYLLKDADADEVAASLRAAYRGELQLDAAVTRALVGAPQGGRGNPAAALTSRELEVLGLVGAGNANKAIARELAITERTTRSHVSSILAKLGLSSRTQLALWAVRNGLASGGDTEDSQAVSA
jgi:DNA-binding NarL/FixJ family response regulator